MNDVAAVLLAGGLARRMGGGDKCLRPLAGRPLLTHVIDRVQPQVGTMLLNAHGDPARFAEFGLPVVADRVEGFAGPLAGIVTGLFWAREHAPAARWVASIATDTPFLPRDLVARLRQDAEEQGAMVACAASGGRTHPVFALWSVELAEPMDAALRAGTRKIDRFTAGHPTSISEFATDPVDPFFNANREEDLAEAGQLATRLL